MDILALTIKLNLTHYSSANSPRIIDELITLSGKYETVVSLARIKDEERRIDYIKGMIDKYSNLASLILHQIYINELYIYDEIYIKWIIQKSRKYNQQLLDRCLSQYISIGSGIINMIEEETITVEEAINFMISHRRVCTLDGTNVFDYIFDNYKIGNKGEIRNRAFENKATIVIKYLEKREKDKDRDRNGCKSRARRSR